jgi:hypothetical protein
MMHSHFREGRQALRRVLNRERGRTREVARALAGASILAVWGGDKDSGTGPAEESLAIWRELEDERETAAALEAIGWTRWFAHDEAGAIAAFEENLATFERLGDRPMIDRAKLGLAQVLISMPDVERATALAREDPREQRNPRDIHFALHSSPMERSSGDAAHAGVHHGQLARRRRRWGHLGDCYEMEVSRCRSQGRGGIAKHSCSSAR